MGPQESICSLRTEDSALTQTSITESAFLSLITILSLGTQFGRLIKSSLVLSPSGCLLSTSRATRSTSSSRTTLSSLGSTRESILLSGTQSLKSLPNKKLSKLLKRLRRRSKSKSRLRGKDSRKRLPRGRLHSSGRLRTEKRKREFSKTTSKCSTKRDLASWLVSQRK